MRPPAPPDLLDTVGRWAALSRWERAEAARALRRLGWSYGEIRSLVDVPTATLSGWCRGIYLTPEQVAGITARTGSRRGVPRDTQPDVGTRSSCCGGRRAGSPSSICTTRCSSPVPSCTGVRAPRRRRGCRSRTLTRPSFDCSSRGCAATSTLTPSSSYRCTCMRATTILPHAAGGGTRFTSTTSTSRGRSSSRRAPDTARTRCLTGSVASCCAGARTRGMRRWPG